LYVRCCYIQHFGGKGLPPYFYVGIPFYVGRHSHADRRGFYVGRHSHADKRSLQPARADALFGGKGLPPYNFNRAPRFL